jgi:DNA-binding transcriptional MerR regulator
MKSGFTRQEVLSMTGSKPGNLSYWDATQLIEPEKYGNPKKPTVIYNAEQVIQIKIIERLREHLSLQEIRKVLDFLKEQDYEPSIFKSQLVFIEDELYLVEDFSEFGNHVLQASGKNKGQIVIHEVGRIGDVIKELREEAERHNVLDFNKRVQGTLLEKIE